MIFQDPVSSLNPRMSVGDLLAEPLKVHRTVPAERRSDKVAELLHMVGMPADVERSYPHELSGGQRQRIAIARALSTGPRFLVADEPVSALDVSVRGQIINLLIDLRERFQLTILFIAHDLAVVEQIADRVAVMYAGKIVELGSTESVYGLPQHPYTASLLSAVPGGGPASRRSRIVLTGEAPDPAKLPGGCRFHPRCPVARDRCSREEPELFEVDSGHDVSCHYPGELGPQEDGPGKHGTFSV
jgi:oligopeptide/dipeptide ABC transporter ATP-binding protein